MAETIEIESFAEAAYRKCDCCKRQKDIYFRANIRDHDTATLLVGSLELCKECGKNLGAITGTPASTQHTVREFKFE